MKKLKVIQVGVGHDHASGAMSTLKSLPDMFEIAGLVIPEEDELEFYEIQKPAYDGVKRLTLEQALNSGADAAVIETADRLLTKYALIFAEAGFAVQMDKPGGTDQGEFERLTDLWEKKSLRIQLGYMYRFNPNVKRLFELAERGELGEILYVNAEMNCFHGPEKRDWLKDYPGGMMYFLGCHLVDVIYRLQGEPEEVIPVNRCVGLGGARGCDSSFALFRYKNGASFARSAAVERGGQLRRQIVAVGTEGTFEIKPTEYPFRGYGKGLLRSDAVFTKDTAWSAAGEHIVSEPFDRYAGMFSSFHAIAAGEKENPYAPEYEKDLHRLILRACGAGENS